MICLTADVHHFLGTPGQLMYKDSESKLAKKYLEIAKKYNLKVTLFITGKAFKEDKEDIKKILNFSNMEIGGHTWSAFRPIWIHKIFKLLTGSVYGPCFYQKSDIRKTLFIIEEKTGARPVSWRTHAYESDENTLKILEREGIKIVSDELSVTDYWPKKMNSSDVISLPINVMPDHEHVYYGPERRMRKQMNLKKVDVFTNKAYSIDRYFDIIKSQIVKINKAGGVATLLLHPQCMWLSDKFRTFEKICRFIAENGYETIWCREAPRYVGDMK